MKARKIEIFIWCNTVRFTRIEKVFTVLWIDGKTVLETDSSLTYGTIPSYDGATPYRPANGEYSYKFIGWSPTISAVTKDISYYAQYESGKRSIPFERIILLARYYNVSIDYLAGFIDTPKKLNW